jgi:hypothetical protein
MHRVTILSRIPSVLRTPYLVLSTQYSVLHPTAAYNLASLATLFVFFIIPLVALSAEPLTDDQAVAGGRDALSKVARFPWYDRREDKVRPLHVVPRDAADSENRGSKWTNNNQTTATPGGPGRRASLFGPVLQWVGLTTLVLLLGVLAYLIAKAFLKDEVAETAVQRKVVEAAAGVDRVEALPLHVRRPAGDFLAEARRLYEAGQYSEAIVYLFSHELLQLDNSHLIRLAKGKTNRQYLHEVRQRPLVQSILESATIAFEDAFFGKKILTRQRFDQCWQQWDELQTELTRLEYSPV